MKYKYWLSNIAGIGPQKIKKLFQVFCGAKEIYYASESQMNEVSALTKREKEIIIESRKKWDLEHEWEKFQKMGVSFYTLEDPLYPSRLRNLYDAPYQIYVKGKLPDEKKKTVAIVGARECSEYGKAMAKEIAYKLAQNNMQIISGMARGIDTYGHVGALYAKMDTFAILGNGVDICYPSSNQKLYQSITEHGGIISEYAVGVKPQARLFPARNRIISALSDYVVLVEAREKSGSLITADFALEQGKDIYAVPGRIYDTLSAGCNELIAQGAGIFLSAEKFLEDNEFIVKNKSNIAISVKNLLEKPEMVVYSCLDFHPKCIEDIIYATGIGLSELSMLLIELQQKGIVKEAFKNYYIRSF